MENKENGFPLGVPSTKKRNIDVKVDKWVEAELKGNYHCPRCGRTMIVIWGFFRWAYCPHCECYFVPALERDQK